MLKLPMIPADKANHFIYGQAIGLVLQLLLVLVGAGTDVLAPAVTAAIFGAGKELWDEHQNSKAKSLGLIPGHEVSHSDWIVTAAGGLSVGLFSLL